MFLGRYVKGIENQRIIVALAYYVGYNSAVMDVEYCT